MEARAILRSARISAQKARLVADQVRGLSAERAVNLLKFSDKKAAGMIRKVVESAIANAENNQGADVDALKVQSITVDEGPTLKRFMARAKGRGTRILKRTSHITIVVGEAPTKLKAAARKAPAKKAAKVGTKSGDKAAAGKASSKKTAATKAAAKTTTKTTGKPTSQDDQAQDDRAQDN